MKIPMLRCKLSGKHHPIDTERSNENWVVYKTVEKCECGGTFQFVLVDEREIEDDLNE